MKVFFLVFVWVPYLVMGDVTFTFKKNGGHIKTLSLAEMKQIIHPTKITVFEAHEEHDQVYTGMKMVPLLDAVYGPTWRETEELLFTCSDGYQPSVPSERFKKNDSYLAYAREGSPAFTLINKLQNSESVDLSPFYLVWDNLKNPALKKEKAEGWPYQVIGVDLIRFADRFPNLAPSKNASAAAKRGFLLFRKHCISCHTINGEGGAKAIELNYPVSVVEYFNERMLKKWIADPTSIRYSTTMPALNSEGGNRDEMVQDLVHYFRAMAKNKKKPLK